jgi:hypothetical protein
MFILNGRKIDLTKLIGKQLNRLTEIKIHMRSYVIKQYNKQKSKLVLIDKTHTEFNLGF